MLFGKNASPRRRYLKPAVIVLGVVVVAGSLVGLRVTQAKKDEPKAPAAQTTLEFTSADIAVVKMMTLERTLPISGSLSPVLQSTVKSKVPGEVRKVAVREGDRVSEGQVIATIDTADLQSKLDSQVAAFEEARARYGIAQKNRENNLQLLRQKFISQNAFDTTDSTFEAAAASMRSAEAQLRMAKKAMDDAIVRAPIAGIVARKMVNPGEKVGVDSPLFAIVDLSRMEIEAPAPASEIPGVKPGQAATFKVDGFGDRVFEGRVERINPTAEQGSRAIVLYLSIANRDGVLRGGMFAQGQLVLDKRAPAPVIPAAAVREEAGQSFVFTIESGKVARRAVTLGEREPHAGLVEIRSGLDTGASVVSARLTGLKPGSPAVIKAAPAKSA